MEKKTRVTRLRALHCGWTSPIIAAALFVGTSATAWARFQPPPACKNPFTTQQEISEGGKAAAQVYQQMPVLPESDPVSRYIAQLGAHLASHAPGGSGAWPYSFHVVASSEINAFALPGGAMFINLGTIQAASTEAQLVGVMSHEISHVILRHATCNMAKQQTKQIEYGIGSILSQILLGNGTAGQVAQAGISGIAGLSYLKMSRDDEKQADLLGTDTLYDAGYDPRGLPQFFEVIQAKYGPGGAQLLSDHPNPGNRTQYVNEEIATLGPHPNAMVTSAVFTRVHQIAGGERTFTAQQITDGAWKNGNYASGPGQGYGNNGQYSQNDQFPVAGHQHPSDSPQPSGSQYPNNGQNPNNGQYPKNGQSSSNGQYPNSSQNDQNPQYGNRGQQYPNGQNNGQSNGQNNGQYSNNTGAVILTSSALGIGGRMATYRGSGYTIAKPGRWGVSSDQGGAVTIAPVGGAGQFGVVYGVLIDVAKVNGNGITDGDSLLNATTQLAQRLSEQNSGMQQSGQVRTMSIGGQGANAVEFRGRSPVIQNGNPVNEHDWLVTVARPDGDITYMVFVSPEQDFARLRPTFVSMMNSFRAAAVQ